MNAQEGVGQERILVLVDASPGSLAALQAAAGLAKLLGQSVEALFIEDVNLLNLAGLPFCREVGTYTASVRLLESGGIEQEFRVVARQLRGVVQQVATTNEIEVHLRIVRGGVQSEALRAAEDATIVGLGRTGRFRSLSGRIGSTLQELKARGGRPLLIGGTRQIELVSPLVVYFSGSAAAERALALSVSLSERRSPAMQIVAAAPAAQAPTADRLMHSLVGERSIRFDIVTPADPAHLRQLMRRIPSTLLILPVDASSLIQELEHTLLIVP